MTKLHKKINPIDTKLDENTIQILKDIEHFHKILMSAPMGIPKKYFNTS